MSQTLQVQPPDSKITKSVYEPTAKTEIAVTSKVKRTFFSYSISQATNFAHLAIHTISYSYNLVNTTTYKISSWITSWVNMTPFQKLLHKLEYTHNLVLHTICGSILIEYKHGTLGVVDEMGRVTLFKAKDKKALEERCQLYFEAIFKRTKVIDDQLSIRSWGVNLEEYEHLKEQLIDAGRLEEMDGRVIFHDQGAGRELCFEGKDREEKLGLYLRWSYKYGLKKAIEDAPTTANKIMMTALRVIMLSSSIIVPTAMLLNNLRLLEKLLPIHTGHSLQTALVAAGVCTLSSHKTLCVATSILAFTKRVQGETPIVELPIIEIGNPFTFDCKKHLNATTLNNLSITLDDGSPLPNWLKSQLPPLGAVTFESPATAVAARGNFTYVSGGTPDAGYFAVVDVSDPNAPIIKGNCLIPGLVVDVKVDGNRAYLIYEGSEFGFDIVDISNPSLPIVLTDYKSNISLYEVAISGNYAYFTTITNFFVYMDISDPLNPTMLGSLNLSHYSYRLAINSDKAYVIIISPTYEITKLVVIDLNIPQHPSIIGNCVTPAYAEDIVINGNLAYVGCDNELQIVDIGDPKTPIIVGSYHAHNSLSRLVLSDHKIYSVDGICSLQMIDITNPKQPLLVGYYNSPGESDNVAAGNGKIYLPYYKDNKGALQIVDTYLGTLTGIPFINDIDSFVLKISAINEKGKPITERFKLTVDSLPKLKNHDVVDSSVNIGEEFNMAFIASSLFDSFEEDYLNISVLRKNGTPLPLWLTSGYDTYITGAYFFSHGIFDIAIGGDRAYIIHEGDLFSTSVLSILDISDTNNPTLLGNCGFPFQGNSVAVSGNEAYVAYNLNDLSGGFAVIDISNSNYPTILSTLSVKMHGWVVNISNNKAYMGLGSGVSGELIIIDISNSLLPTIISSCDNHGVVFEIAISNNLAYSAYMGNNNYGLNIIDISNPALPAIIGTFSISGLANALCVYSNRVYVEYSNDPDFDGGHFAIIDVSDSTKPTLISQLKFLDGGYSNRNAIQGDKVYLPTSQHLYVIDVSNSTRPAILDSCNIPDGASSIAISQDLAYVVDGHGGLQIIDIGRRQISGTPSKADAENIDIMIKATDPYGASAYRTFTLRVEGAPVLQHTIKDFTAIIGQETNFFFLADTFKDPNNDPLYYNATLADGSKLPPWLEFNPWSGTFISNPPEILSEGVLNITVIADDRRTEPPATTTFTLALKNVPEVTHPLQNQVAVIGRQFSFTVPLNTFEIKSERRLSYSATLKGGFPLPKWLEFNAQTRTFTGAPVKEGGLQIDVTARDTNGFTCSAEFALSIIRGTGPIITNPIADLHAKVEESFSFTVPEETFTDSYGGVLTYSADLGEASNWLTYDSASKTFHGRPRRWDAHIYRDRTYKIQLNVTNASGQSASSFFDILLAGPSLTETIITATSITLGTIGSIYGGYSHKYLLWNWVTGRKKYKKRAESILVGATTYTHQLSVPPAEIKNITVKIAQKTWRWWFVRKEIERNFSGNEIKIRWIRYDPSTNSFVAYKTINRDDVGRWTFQIRDHKDEIQEEYNLEIQNPLNLSIVNFEQRT